MDIKSKFSSALSWLCTTLLSLLGYSCSGTFEPELMYGTPHGTFEVKGSVTNEEGDPLPDVAIEVKATEIWYIFGTDDITRTITNDKGFYTVSDSYFMFDSIKIVCTPSDNTYLPDSTKVKLNYHYDDDHKESFWYKGHANLTVDFNLKDNPEK